jgi:hypothetical protein
MHGRCRCGRGCRRLTASSGVSSPSARCSAPSSPPPSAPLVGLFRWSARASLEVLCISLRTCAGCQLPVTWRHREKGEASRRDSSGFVPCSVPDRPYPDWTPTDATGGPWFPRFNGAMIWARAALFKIDVSWLMTLTSTGPIVSLPLSYLIKGQPLNFGSLNPLYALYLRGCAQHSPCVPPPATLVSFWGLSCRRFFAAAPHTPHATAQTTHTSPHLLLILGLPAADGWWREISAFSGCMACVRSCCSPSQVLPERHQHQPAGTRDKAPSFA